MSSYWFQVNISESISVTLLVTLFSSCEKPGSHDPQYIINDGSVNCLGSLYFLSNLLGWIFRADGPRKEIDRSKHIFKFSTIMLVPYYVPTSDMRQIFFPHNRRYFQVCVFNCAFVFCQFWCENTEIAMQF